MHDEISADEPYQVARTMSEVLEIGHMTADADFESDGSVTFDFDLWTDEDRGASVGARACKILQDAGYHIDEVEMSGTGNVWLQASVSTEGE